MPDESRIPQRPPAERTAAWLFTLAFLSLVFLFLLVTAMRRGLDHDEHQFVASGALLAGRGLLPYRDYPYFHMPNLVFLYGALFSATPWLLLAARLVSVVSAFGVAALLFRESVRSSAAWPPVTRSLLGAGAVLLLLSNPIFRFTTGRAWNHDLPVLLTLLAFLALCRSRREASGGWLVASGLLASAAVGTRLTFLPAAAALLAMVVLDGGAAGARLRRSLAFFAGAALALAPSVVLAALAPRQFYFGNLGYALLNTAYRVLEGHPRTTLVGKLRHFAGDVLLEPNVIFLLALAAWALLVVTRREDPHHPRTFEISALALLCVGLLAGSFLPSPSFLQYFYAPLPFVILLAVYATHEGPGRRLEAFAGVVALSCLVALHTQSGKVELRSATDWYTLDVHRAGRRIAGHVGEGKVLTLAPLFALEGGLDIYESLATGPLAFRVAPLLPPEERHRQRLVGPEDLSASLATDPPAAVLVEAEREPKTPAGELEAPLRNVAAGRRFQTIELADESVWGSSRPKLLVPAR